jgi:hypothetical protein
MWSLALSLPRVYSGRLALARRPDTQALKYLPVLLASPQQLDKLSLRDEPLLVPGSDDPKPQVGSDERSDPTMTTRNQTAAAVVTENSSKGLNGAARDGHGFDFRGVLDTAIRQLFARKQFTHRQQISCDLVEFDV